MSGKKKMLIAITLVVIMLLNVCMPILKVGATTTAKITFESNLYEALKDELINQNIDASYIDEQRTIIIGEEEIAKVTDLSLANAGITDLTGLENFKNLTKLDLSANKLSKDSNLEVLNSFNLSTLDLSSNCIEDISMITGLDSIQNVYLHNQKFDVVQFIELDTSKTSDQITEVSFALPEIISKAGYLKTDWLIEENKGNAKIIWNQFDHKNIKIKVAEKTDTTYMPFKEMVKLTIKISDQKNTLYNSDINLYFIIVDSEERGIYIPDTNMYKAIKSQLKSGQTINSNLISYSSTSSNIRRNLYERYYDDAQTLVISIDDIVNKISSLKLSNKKIEKLDGIEKFVGLEIDLDLSGNYIKSIDKLIELQENQVIEEQKLRERVREQLGLVSDTVSKINTINDSIKSEQTVLDKLNKAKEELKEKCDKLEAELAELQNKKAELETEKEILTGEVEALQAQMEELNATLELANQEITALKQELIDIKANKANLETELANLKSELTNLESSLSGKRAELESKIAEKEKQIDVKNQEIVHKQTDIDNKQKEIDASIEEVNKKQEEIDAKTTTIAIYDTQISDINILLAQKNLEVSETNELYNSMNAGFANLIFSRESITDNWNQMPGSSQFSGRREEIITMLVDNLMPVTNKANEILELIESNEDTEKNIESEITQAFDNLKNIKESAKTALEDYRNQNISIHGETELGIYVGEYITSLENCDIDKLKTETIEIYKLINSLDDETIELLEEKERLQTEIDKLRAVIGSTGNGGLESEKSRLEYVKKQLEAERDTLESEKNKLQNDLTSLSKELETLNQQLRELEESEEYVGLEKQIEDKKAEIEAKEKQIVTVQEQITAKETELSKAELGIEEYRKQIEAKQKEITEKQTELKAKETALAEKEKEIASKISEIAKVIEEINKQNESIAQSELKIAELEANKEKLEEILLSQMSRLYEIYNRVDKLTSIITSDLKTMTNEEFTNLTFEEAKSLFNAQIQKISNSENCLTEFEKNYLIEKYDIALTVEVEKEKVIQNEDGSTTTIKETEIKEIENPIATHFKTLSEGTSEWNLSNYKAYLNSFRTDDLYFSMAAYCYIYRLFNGTTSCVAKEYIDIEVKKLEFDDEPTTYLKNAKNNYTSIANQYGANCSGTATDNLLLNYATKMVNSAGEIDVYVTLPRLKSLDIDENLIENIDKISELPELRRLYAYDNEIVDISNVNWASMTKLRILDLGFNGISNIDPLEELVNIKELYLRGNLISGSFDFDISKLSNLKELDLSENQIDDIEKLINYLEYEARAKGYDDVASYLRSASTFNLNLKAQNLSMKVETKFDVNEKRKIDLPKFFRQIEEIDYANTSFGIDSYNGNVTSDGKQVLLDTTREGNLNAVVSIINTKNTVSIGSGTTCTINYTVGNVEPVTVTITPAEVDVMIGGTQEFTADVTGENVTYKGVTWEVQGATSAETEISDIGLLTVGAEETAETLTVKATSIYDETASAEAKVTIIQKEVSTITVTPETTTIYKGESAEFTAVVEGINLEESDKAVEWQILVNKVTNEAGEEVVPTPAEGTKANYDDKKLVLTIGANETIDTFVVEATSKLDNTKVARAVVKVDERTVSAVTIDPTEARVEKGKTQTFTAVVDGNNLRTEDKTIAYVIEGNNSTKTTISQEGVLTVSSDETASTITVKAISNYDNTKVATATVKVVSKSQDSETGYTFDEEFISGIATKTPIDEFKAKFSDEYTVIVKKDGKEVTSGYITTGMYVEIQDENGETVKDENGYLLVYQAVVKGDINGDGIADALDSNLIKAHRNEVIALSDLQKEAADIDNNGEINLLDSKLLLYHRAEVKGYSLDYVK